MFEFRPWLVFLLCSCVAANLVDDVINALKNAVDCDSCHALLVPLKGVALLGDSELVNIISTVCTTLKLEDADVCDGTVGQLAPILAHDLRSISTSGQTASKICDAVFGLCQPPPVNQYTVPFPKPAPANPKVFESSGKPPIQIVHFSDVHIDRQYTTGADVNCTKPICCRNYADHTGPASVPAGPNGSHKCDTPTVLADSMLEAIEQFAPNNAFSIFTGDVVEAALWSIDQTEVSNDLEAFNSQMAAKLHKPVFPAIGNHEAAPVNAFPRNTTADVNAQWIFDIESNGWAQWINAAAANQVASLSGSYSVIAPGTNLRIISINTVYWYKQNYWLYDSDAQQPDPNGVLAFAVQELQAAEDAGQRAWIIAHIPPGRQDVLNDQSNYFDQVIQRYHNTIAAQFYGHSHVDEFAIAYSDYNNRIADNAVSIAWIVPSLTPRAGNPGFKIYDVDPDTYEVMDAHVYRTDLSSPAFQTQPTWELYYGARDTYGPLVGVSPSEPLGPSFWHKVTEAFAANDDAFQKFITFRTVGFNPPQCNATCKTTTICELRALRAEDNCEVTAPGLQFKRNLDGSTSQQLHDDPCEGTSLSHIFSQLAEKMTFDPSAMHVPHLRKRLEEALPYL